METQPSFDLNFAIRRWRDNLARSSAFRSENLNELESHLRDSIDRLRARELSDEEAFLVATRRIGQNEQLEPEFSKLNRGNIWLGRAMWMLIGIQVWPIFDRLTSGIAGCIFAMGWGNVRHSASAVGDAWPVFFSALIQLLAFGAAVWLTWKALRNSDKFGQWVAMKLPERSSFAYCCVAVSILSFVLYSSAVLIGIGWFKFSGRTSPFVTVSYIDNSRNFLIPLRIIGFATLTLLIARKQFVEKKPDLRICGRGL